MHPIFQALARAAPPTPLRAQVTPETINRLLDANAQQITGVLAVLVGVAILAILGFLLMQERNRAKAQQQNFELLKAQIENNARQTQELQHQSQTLDELEFHLSSISGNIAENLNINRERALVHDVNAANIDKLLTQFKEVITKLDAALERDPALSPDTIRRFEGKLDLIITSLQLKAKDALPEEPPSQPLEPGGATP